MMAGRSGPPGRSPEAADTIARWGLRRRGSRRITSEMEIREGVPTTGDVIGTVRKMIQPECGFLPRIERQALQKISRQSSAEGYVWLGFRLLAYCAVTSPPSMTPEALRWPYPLVQGREELEGAVDKTPWIKAILHFVDMELSWKEWTYRNSVLSLRPHRYAVRRYPEFFCCTYHADRHKTARYIQCRSQRIWTQNGWEFRLCLFLPLYWDVYHFIQISYKNGVLLSKLKRLITINYLKICLIEAYKI